jgi:hypothetical protein
LAGDSLPLFAPTFFLLCFHLVQQAVQPAEVFRPQAPILLHPQFKLLERFRPQSINSALRVDANADDSGLTQDAEMFGNLRLAETQLIDEVADRAGSVEQEFDDLKAVGLGEGFEGFEHWASMPQREYSCQRI